MRHEIQVCDFRGEFDQLSSMIKGSWGMSHYDYGPHYLRWLWSAPQVAKGLTLGCYRGEELVGFTLCSQRNIVYSKNTYPIILCTLLTIKGGVRNFSLLFHLYRELISRLRAEGHHYFFYFSEDSERLSNLFSGHALYNSIQLSKISTFRYLISDIALLSRQHYRKLKDGRIEISDKIDEGALSFCRRLFNTAPNGTIRQIWSARDITYYFLPSNYRFTFIIRSDQAVVGAINGQLIDYISLGRTMRTAVIENIAYVGIDERELFYVLDSIIQRLAERRVLKILIPDTGYFDSSPWLRYGFLKGLRKTHLNVSSLHGSIPFQNIHNFYLEVM